MIKFELNGKLYGIPEDDAFRIGEYLIVQVSNVLVYLVPRLGPKPSYDAYLLKAGQATLLNAETEE